MNTIHHSISLKLAGFLLWILILGINSYSVPSQALNQCQESLNPKPSIHRTYDDLKRRLRNAHDRFDREGKQAKIALVTVVSPDYDVPTFNLSNAELAGYLRYKNPELNKGISFIEPDITLAQTPELKQSVEYTLAALRKIKPHIIGLGAKIGSTDNLLKILGELDKESWAQDTIIVVGNVLSTFSNDRLSDAYPNVLFATGDGELMIDSLYQHLKLGNEEILDIPNIAFRQNDGEIALTRKEILKHSEQNWLPAFDMLNTNIAHRADVTIRATTGCSAGCTFCSIRSLGLYTNERGNNKSIGWQSFPPERTAKIMKILQRNGLRKVNFADDEFGNVDFRFLEKLADLLIEQNNDVHFNVSMRLDAFWRPEMSEVEFNQRHDILIKLKKAGLDSLFVGAESGSPTQLKRYGKGYPVEVNLKAIELLITNNIDLSIGFIPFDQFVNRHEIEENFTFLESSVAGHKVYEYVASPINVMRVQRSTPYAKQMERSELLGNLEDNLTFYETHFVDPRMEKVAQLGLSWFREIIDQRYPIIQLVRMSKGNSLFSSDISPRSEAALKKMHELDIQYVRALLRVFPEDKFEASMQPLNTSFLKGHPLLAEAKQKWSRDVDSAESELHNLHTIFSQRRAALVTEMQAILHDAYPHDNPPN